MNVAARINYFNDGGDQGTLRHDNLELSSMPSKGSSVRVRKGGRFYDVERVLISDKATTLDLGTHNLSPDSVNEMLASGWKLGEYIR